MSDATATQTETSPHAAQISGARRGFLLVAFCIAQFFDVFNFSALFPGIPIISEKLDLTPSQSVWLISAYQLTLASFLLMSGRLSDIYNPKYVFNLGFGGLGIFCLISGFVHNKIALIVLRALSGVAGAITIPSALNLIVHLYPDPAGQAKAIGIFGSSAALANVFGIVLGGILVQFASWSWIFWLTACLAIPTSILCVFLIPTQAAHAQRKSSLSKIEELDIVGIFTLTVAFVLFIFALTSGGTDGWGTATVLAPLIISIFMMAAFLLWETRIPEERAAIPPSVWRYHNFTPLFFTSLLPFFWFSSSFFLQMSMFQEAYHWTPVGAGVRFLPIGVFATLTMGTAAGMKIQDKVSIKKIFAVAIIFLIPGTILLPFADRQSRYWSYVFPAFIIGTIGTSLVYNNANVAIFRYTPPARAGVVGAIFNSALQMGSAIGLAILTAIQDNVSKDPTAYKGRAAGYWFLFAFVCVTSISMMVFIREGDGEPLPGKELPKSSTASVDGDVVDGEKRGASPA